MYDSVFMKILAIVPLLLLFNGCLQNTALLGPAITIASTGNVYHAGLSYGSNAAIKNISGKTTFQNIKKILTQKKINNNATSLIKKK
jgi:hypothetical protein